jgi:hypothetical protein
MGEGKKIIHSLQTTDGIFVLQEDKEKVVFDHFSTHFGQKEQREVTLNWEELILLIWKRTSLWKSCTQ